ncbi:MAG: DUF4922 domain-containing protein [Bacteroidota bacterium]
MDKLFKTFRRGGASLSSLSLQLLEQQKRSWKTLAAGYASLEKIQIREIQCTGFSAWLQWNPGRIVSTGAKVDAKSIEARPCFLCVENLPKEQQGILYGEDFLVLCNPAPIFRQHYTISNLAHIPQSLEPFVHTFLNLAKDLSPGFTVFYNGPRCGASAPDHMHFQASPSGAIPVEKEALDPKRRVLLKNKGSVSKFLLQNYGRQVVVLESKDQSELENSFLNLLKVWKHAFGTVEEPMMNVLCSCTGRLWRLIVFPRRKHRPEVYFKKGDKQVLISPAAVDIGGLIVTPREKDFRSLDAKMVEAIFREVTIEDDDMQKIARAE